MQLKPKKDVLPEIENSSSTVEPEKTTYARSFLTNQMHTFPIAPDGYIPWSAVRGVLFGPKGKPNEEEKWRLQPFPGGYTGPSDSITERVRLMSYCEQEDEPYNLDLDLSDLEEITEEEEEKEQMEIEDQSEESSGNEESPEDDKKDRPVIDWLGKKPKEIKYVRKVIPQKKPEVITEEIKDRLHPLIKEIVSRPWFPQSVSRTVGGVVSAFMGLMDLVNNEVHTEICNYIIRFKNELGFPDEELDIFINKLMAQLDHVEARKRVNAVKTLAKLGVATNVVITAVIKHLIDDEPEVRKAAELCLSQLKDIQDKDQLVSYLESIGAYKRNPTKLSQQELGEFLQKKAALSMSKFGEETGFDPLARVREWIKGVEGTEVKPKKKVKKRRKVVKPSEPEPAKGPIFKVKRRKMPKSFIIRKKFVPNNKKMWKMFERKKAGIPAAKKTKRRKSDIKEKDEVETATAKGATEDEVAVSPQKLADKLRELEGEDDPNKVIDWEVTNTKAMQELLEQEKLQVIPCAPEDVPSNWHEFFELPFVRARKDTDQTKFTRKRKMQPPIVSKAQQTPPTTTTRLPRRRKIQQQKKVAVKQRLPEPAVIKKLRNSSYAATAKLSRYAKSKPSKQVSKATPKPTARPTQEKSDALREETQKAPQRFASTKITPSGLPDIQEAEIEYTEETPSAEEDTNIPQSNALQRLSKTPDESESIPSIPETKTASSEEGLSTVRRGSTVANVLLQSLKRPMKIRDLPALKKKTESTAHTSSEAAQPHSTKSKASQQSTSTITLSPLLESVAKEDESTQPDYTESYALQQSTSTTSPLPEITVEDADETTEPSHTKSNALQQSTSTTTASPLPEISEEDADETTQPSYTESNVLQQSTSTTTVSPSPETTTDADETTQPSHTASNALQQSTEITNALDLIESTLVTSDHSLPAVEHTSHTESNALPKSPGTTDEPESEPDSPEIDFEILRSRRGRATHVTLDSLQSLSGTSNTAKKPSVISNHPEDENEDDESKIDETSNASDRSPGITKVFIKSPEISSTTTHFKQKLKVRYVEDVKSDESNALPQSTIVDAESNALHWSTKSSDEAWDLPSIPEAEIEGTETRPKSAKVYRPSQIIRPFRLASFVIPIRQDAWCNMERQELKEFLNSEWIPPSSPEPWPLRSSNIPDKAKTGRTIEKAKDSSNQKEIQYKLTKPIQEFQRKLARPIFAREIPHNFETASVPTSFGGNKKNQTQVQLPPLSKCPHLNANEDVESKKSFLSLPPCNKTKSRAQPTYWEPLTMPAFSENKIKLFPSGADTFRWEDTFADAS